MKVSGLEPTQRAPSAQGSSGSTLQADQSAAGGAASSPEYTKEGLLSSEAMRQAHQEWIDAQVISTACAFCSWTHEGPAGEGRAAARVHREKKHPEACILKPRMRRRISKRKNRSAAEEAQIAVDTEEARRVRSEREQGEMLAKIERGRERDRAALAALDGSS